MLEEKIILPFNVMQFPSLMRRLGALLYEVLTTLSVGVLFYFLYSLALMTHPNWIIDPHAYVGKLGLFLVVLLLGFYFSWFWVKSGQTLAMKIWHIKVVSINGLAVSSSQAITRYIAAFILMICPGFIIFFLLHLPMSKFSLLMLGWWLCYLILARLVPSQQSLHDMVAHTTIIRL